LGSALSTSLGMRVTAEPSEWTGGATVRVTTRELPRVFSAIRRVAGEMGTDFNVGVRDIDRMAHLLKRLLADVGA
jgi:hypothetical protein